MSPLGRAAAAATAQTTLTVTWAEDPTDPTRLLARIPGPEAVAGVPLLAELVAATIDVRGVSPTNGRDASTVPTDPSTVVVTSLDTITGTTTLDVVLQTSPVLQPLTPVEAATSGGPPTVALERVPSLMLEAGTAAVLGIVAGTTTPVSITWREAWSTVATSRYVWGAYVNSTQPDSAYSLRALATTTSAVGAYPLGTLQSGQSDKVWGCSFATVSYAHTIWIDENDVGNLPGQLPPQYGGNNIQTLNFFPSFFVTRGAWFKAITSLEYGQKEPVTSADGAPFVYVATRDAQYSKWRLTVDGSQVEYIIDHNGVGRLRTPRQIYQGVLLPKCQTGFKIYKATPMAFVEIGQSLPLAYLTTAEFVWAWGGDPTVAVYMPFAQTGATMTPTLLSKVAKPVAAPVAVASADARRLEKLESDVAAIPGTVQTVVQQSMAAALKDLVAELLAANTMRAAGIPPASSPAPASTPPIVVVAEPAAEADDDATE